jgi:hypothetical protein
MGVSLLVLFVRGLGFGTVGCKFPDAFRMPAVREYDAYMVECHGVKMLNNLVIQAAETMNLIPSYERDYKTSSTRSEILQKLQAFMQYWSSIRNAVL